MLTPSSLRSLVGLALVAPLCAQAPPGYYSSVDTTNATTLRSTLHAVIDDHQWFPYSAGSTDTWNILEAADEDPANGSRVLDVYRNESFPKAGGGNSNYNREHTWPRSYGFPDEGGSNYPHNDCHQLFLCDVDYNSARGNRIYGDCNPGCVEEITLFNSGMGGGSGTYPGNSNWTDALGLLGRFEVWADRQGDVARALLYLDVRYEGGMHGGTGADEPDLILTDDESLISASNTGNNLSTAYMGLLSVLLQWHADDPVDAIEEARNDAVFSFQGNRNPFIDHPEWVDCLFGGMCNGGPGGGDDSPWINELHYDNGGPDVDERVEIAGPAGTSLAGWSLVAYNGSGGTVYQTLNLSGTIGNQGGCIGTLSFLMPGLQNGSPDGLALVDDAGDVVEFLSYEGVFTANGGPADGLTSFDIGVVETSLTSAGTSLGLTGSGAERADFTWGPSQAATPDAPNGGQAFVGGCPPGDMQPPAVPSGLAAAPGDESVTLTWNANTEPDLAIYRVSRATSFVGPYQLIATPTSPILVDTGLTNGVTYFYVVAAEDTSGNISGTPFPVSVTPAGFVRPSEVVRNGTPANPLVFTGGTAGGPVVGSTWDPVVAPFLPGAVAHLMFVQADGVQLNVPSPFGTFLGNVPASNFFFFSTVGARFSVAIPADSSLVGLFLVTQGAGFAPGPVVMLTNALDVVIGG